MADPYFASVVLLLHLDGANGSKTIPDASPANHLMTAVDTGALATAQQKFGTASYLPTSFTVSAITAPDSADWHFGAGQFTIEAWIRPTNTPSGVTGIVTQFGGSSNLGWFFGFNDTTLNFFYSTTGTDNPVVSGSYTPTNNAWVHVAVDRDASNVLRVYAGGAVIASGTVAATFFDSTRLLNIANDNGGIRGFLGYIDEVRITKGVARYAGAFTPPTAPFDDVGPTGGSASVGGMTAQAYAHRRRFMQTVELDPRLRKKLGIRGKLVVLE